MNTTIVREPARDVPIVHDCDLCVIGGSCTGVFAAVRAARLGLRVAVVEQATIFGGNATAAQVTHWHSTLNVDQSQKIIGGLLDEVVDRLRMRRAVRDVEPIERVQYKFNSAELAIELDRLVVEHGIRPFLATRFSTPIVVDGRIQAVIVEDKAGRRAIRAAMFVDASGDGDLVRRAGFEAIQHEILQPASLQSLVVGLNELYARNPEAKPLWPQTRHLADRHGFPQSNPWGDPVPGATGLTNMFGARMNGVDASDPDKLTRAYIEGRRLARAYLDMIHERFGAAASDVALASVAMQLGIRETWHACCLHRVTEDELLSGERFDDAIANGTYPVDIHYPGGTDLRYLDGRQSHLPPGEAAVWSRWKPEGAPTPPFYQIPYRSLVPRGSRNLLIAGRLLDSDRGAYGAARVMVNCNQMGEAAGVACWLALTSDTDVPAIDVAKLRRTLADGGSIVL